MAKFGSGKKPANQGSPGTPHVKPAKVSPTAPTRVVKNTTPSLPQDQRHRGFHTPGKGGSGTTKSGPKPFKG